MMTSRIQEVSFRSLTKAQNFSRDTRHGLHSYPARLLPNIPSYFFNSGILDRPGIILDPFAGSGTVLLESALAGHEVLGAEINPLATLITEVKLSKLNAAELREANSFLKRIIRDEPSGELPELPNIDHWYYKHVQRQLQCIFEAIRKISVRRVRRFFLLSFSTLVRNVSLADPRLSVPVRLKEEQYSEGHVFRASTAKRLRRLKRINVRRVFEEIVEGNIARIEASKLLKANFHGIANSVDSIVTFCDKKNLLGKVDAVITSPPYCGAQKYIRATSLQLYWLELVNQKKITRLHSASLGREHFPVREYETLHKTGIDEADQLLESIHQEYPLRAHIAAKFLTEMSQALFNISQCLKADGHLVLVIGNNTIRGREFPTSEYVAALAGMQGFKVESHFIDDIRSRGLMTARNKTASIINAEHVFVFRRK